MPSRKLANAISKSKDCFKTSRATNCKNRISGVHARFNIFPTPSLVIEIINYIDGVLPEGLVFQNGIDLKVFVLFLPVN